MRKKKNLNLKIFCFLLSLFLFTGINELPAQNRKPDNVTLSLKWLTQSQFAGYYAALDKGFYNDEGINLVIKPGAPDIDSMSLVSSGVSDFGIQWFCDVVAARDKGLPLISIAQILQSNGLVMISKAESGIKTTYDFKGKRVGIWLFGNEIQFYSLMNQLEIPLGSINISPLKWSIRPFLDNTYDAVMSMRYNEYLSVLESGYRKEDINIIDFADYGMNFPGDIIFTRKSTFDNNPGLCIRMVRASLRGWEWAMEHQEEAVDIVIRHDKSGTLKKNHQMAQLKEIVRLIKYKEIPLGFHLPEQAALTVDNLKKNGIITENLKLTDIYTNAVWEKAVPEGKNR